MVEQARRVSRQLSDDMQLRVVSGPNRYQAATDKPVCYVPVIGSVPFGFLWYCDDDDAAHYLQQASGGLAAAQASVGWAAVLLEAREAGLKPSEAVLVWAAKIDAVRLGKVIGSTPQVSTLAELKALAANS
ncbi:hypothetical protein SAMN05892883_0207 [Jatrophihabitans sp. GAS493]|uniref:hypothetical protein n=1 Tax=Jatrophihabitans sp. GAS493 TaxID=1907575 RepID=UPI000BB98041|nr:hypothetical protein [Jatrophihabitans sp. GAS493]SOD70515.1 hypothetical protein SAMN05892883_0207 [Jatrophihabitans sp. GAS493]